MSLIITAFWVALFLFLMPVIIPAAAVLLMIPFVMIEQLVNGKQTTTEPEKDKTK